MRTRILHVLSLGMEVMVQELSSDSEDEVSAHSPDHKRPARQAGPGPNRGGGCAETGSCGISEQGSVAQPLHQPSDAGKKCKEKVGEEESAWAAGPPKLGGESIIGARDRAMGAGSDPWSVLASKAGDGGNGGPVYWGGWGDAEMFAHGSTREVSGCHDFPMEDRSSSWSPNFLLPDEHMEDSSSSWSPNFQLPDEQLRTRQIDEDEMFARKLQDQLNEEQPASQHSEAIDMTIAEREGQSSSSQRDGSMAQLHSYGQHFPVQGFASWASNRTPIPMPSTRGLQRRFNSPQMEERHMIISQLTRECFREDMDLEMRMAVLDSLQEALDSIADPLFPDSDDDDYENLIALDDNNHHRGATDEQINSLPLSVVEGGRCCDEPCAICLDCPTVGDSLRHLPCLHKFHKECIDRWLGMKNFCPVCKLDMFLLSGEA
uniref:RING-type domain-containing protein n=1 Tax=Arundo donax TaxID=35708 RepID=A0A0A9HAS2_ARUDO